MFSLIDFQPEHREQIVSQAILKLFKETDLDLEPNLPKNDLLSEVDHLPHSKIDSILGDVKGNFTYGLDGVLVYTFQFSC